MKPKKLVLRAVWIALGLVALGAFASVLLPAAVRVETARCERGALASTVASEGRIQVTQRYVVAAPVDGELERIEVRPGDPVARDTILARIRPGASRPLDPRSRAEAATAVTASEAAVARADASRAEAEIALEHAQSLLSTSQKLVDSAAVPASEAEHAGHEKDIRLRARDQTVAAARQARAALGGAQAFLGVGKGDGQVTAVVSPAAGQILRVLHDNAGPIAAGTPIMEIGDVAQLQAVADLLSADATMVRAGAAALITGWGGNEQLRAHVRRVDPAAFTKVSALGLEEQRVHVTLDFDDRVPVGLGHDYRVDIAIVVWKGDDVLRVRSTALFRSGERWTVFAVRQGRARAVQIEPGQSDSIWTVVNFGLTEGETVIVQPSDQLRDGERVRP